MILWKLFIVFFRIGLFAIGGAYSFLPLIQKEVVDNYSWLSREEFLDVLGLVKLFPGAISIKYATYTGHKVAGIPGAIVANIGNLLAPVIIIVAASYFYARSKDVPLVKNAFSMIQLGVFSMIIAVAFQTITVSQLTQVKNVAIIAIAFILFLYTKIHPAFIIVGAGFLGALMTFWK